MSDNRATVGAPILGLLGLIFVTLKLAGIGVVAGWSWAWVLAPFWAPLALAVGLLVVAGILLGLGKLIDAGLNAWDQHKAKAKE